MASDETNATKADLKEVETSLRGDFRDLRGEFTDLRGEFGDLRGAFGVLREDFGVLRAEVGGLRQDVHVLGVRFERLESKVDAVIEGLTGFRSHFTTEMQALAARLSARISLLEEVVREHSRLLRKHSDDICKLTDEVAELRRRFDRRDDYVELDKRVAALEERLRTR